MSDQIWKVPVSPAQRFILIQLAHGQEQKIKGGQAGRVFRRFMRAFALDRIRESLRKHDNKCNPKHATDEHPALFEVTAENVEQALKLAECERGPADEMTIGPLFDLLEDLKSGRGVEPSDAPVFDPNSDDWAPKAAGDEDDVADQIATALDARYPEAAVMVRSGVWDS